MPLFGVCGFMYFADSVCDKFCLKFRVGLRTQQQTLVESVQKTVLLTAITSVIPLANLVEGTAPISSSLGIEMTLRGAKRFFDATSREVGGMGGGGCNLRTGKANWPLKHTRASMHPKRRVTERLWGLEVVNSAGFPV